MNVTPPGDWSFPDSPSSFLYNLVQESILHRLMQGHVREIEHLPDLLEQFGLHFPSAQFALLGIRLCQEDHNQPDNWSPPPEPNILQLAEEYLHQVPGWDVWCVFSGDVFFCLLCRSGDIGVAPLAIGNALVAHLCPFYPVAIATSSVKSGLEGIHNGYFEVMEVLGVLDMQGSQNTAVAYESLDAAAYCTMDTTFERDRRLINCVLEGNQEGALQTLSMMISSGSLEKNHTLMMEKRRLLGLVNQMTSEITQLEDNSFLSGLNAFPKIMEAPTVQRLHNVFRSVAMQLCDYYALGQDVLGSSRAKQIAAYLHLHYTDPNLSIDSISGIFKISPSYLSRIFKREIGSGMLPYLQNIRITQSCLLLANTQTQIQEIAQRVGFSNHQTFTRTFKSIVGITPSEYRESRLAMGSESAL